MSRYAYVIVQVAGFLINTNTLVIAHKSERDPSLRSGSGARGGGMSPWIHCLLKWRYELKGR
jgi:hypothetical protein